MVAVVVGSGEVWKMSDPAALVGYLQRHRGHLRPLLLFEAAHERQATPAMRAAARLGSSETDGALGGAAGRSDAPAGYSMIDR